MFAGRFRLFSALLLCGGAATLAAPATPACAESEPSDVPAVRSSSPSPLAASSSSQHLALALRYSASGGGGPMLEQLLVKDGHVVCYNQATRNAVWVLQRLVRRRGNDSGEEVTRENSQFLEDKAIPAKFRAKLSDYARSGYDRGHLAPAGDFKPHLGGSQQMMDATFLLSNISPQVGVGFNRDYWARLEMMVRDFTRSYDEVVVFTGGLFLPRQDAQTGKWYVKYEVIGDPPAVAVPTHFYKVVLAVKRLPASDGRQELVAVDSFVVPNQVVPANIPVMTFRKTVDEVERAAGVQFFDPAVTRNRICDIDPAMCVLPKEDFWKDKKKNKPHQKKN